MPLSVSIIVPTYRECDNLKKLVEDVFAAFTARKRDFNPSLLFVEMVIVDDNSNDGSVELIEALSKKFDVRICVRENERGLSSAVLKGFQVARGDVLLVMDADLQHPCATTPDMILPFHRNHTIQCAFGRRVIPKSSAWPFHRRMISLGATWLAYPLTLGVINDPMTGFFAIRRKRFLEHSSKVNPVGYKIALEIFMKCGIRKNEIAEVSFTFGERHAGESKLTSRILFTYVYHLLILMLSCRLKQLFVLIFSFVALYLAVKQSQKVIA